MDCPPERKKVQVAVVDFSVISFSYASGLNQRCTNRRNFGMLYFTYSNTKSSLTTQHISCPFQLSYSIHTTLWKKQQSEFEKAVVYLTVLHLLNGGGE